MFNPSLVDPNGQDYNPQDGHFANAGEQFQGCKVQTLSKTSCSVWCMDVDAFVCFGSVTIDQTKLKELLK